jgi:hypothetical protein
MISISPDIRLLASLKTGSVYYFEEEKLQSAEPHYFIVLNKSPRQHSVLFLACASSQVEKRKRAIATHGLSPETLVLVAAGDYQGFSKETAIDCNTVFEKSTLSVIDMLANKKLKICTEIMPTTIMEKLASGVLASMQVSEDIKRHIRK